jgi:uncharacterized membrane protein YjgN (DUF898 family)
MTFVELPGAVPRTGTFGAVSVPPVKRPVRFVGSGRDYLRLLVRGAMLLALTLGIYRFWFATDVRRFLWSNTEVGDERLEYTGTPYELLIGFLIALAILVPFYVLFFIVALGAGPIGQAITVATFPFLAFLGQFAIYRARRYRLTRTVFRGLRCHQGGSALSYAVCALFWWVVVALTLGLAYPAMQAQLERFKLRHTYYGNIVGRFEGSAAQLFWRGVLMWLVTVGPLVAGTVLVAMAIDWRVAADSGDRSGEEVIERLLAANPNLKFAFGIAVVAGVGGMTLAAVLFPAFQAMTLRWWISGLRIGDVELTSHLRTGHIYGAYLRFLLWGLLFGLVVAIVGVVGGAVIFVTTKEIAQKETVEIIGAVVAVAFYVIVMLGYSTIYNATVRLTLWRHGMETIEIKNMSALDNVQAAGTPSSAVGEGLADALNVGGI